MRMLLLLGLTRVAHAALAITDGATQTLQVGYPIALTGFTSTNHVCWTSGTTPVTALCGPAFNTNPSLDAGQSGCSASLTGASHTVTWTTTGNTDISFIECAHGTNDNVNAAVAIDITLGGLVVSTGSGTQQVGSLVKLTGITITNHVCWTAAAIPTAIAACAVADSVVDDAGLSGCSAVTSGTTIDIAWTTTTKYISFIECLDALTTVVGIAKAIVLTEGGLVVGAQVGSTVTVSGLTPTNYVCWTAGGGTADACAGAGNSVDVGASACSANTASDATTFIGSWTTIANTQVSFIECKTDTTLTKGIAKAIVFIVGGLTIGAQVGSTIALTGVTSGNHVCWTAAGTATPVTECAAAGSDNIIDTTSGCSEVAPSTLSWTTENVHVSIIECDDTNLVGIAKAIVFSVGGLVVHNAVGTATLVSGSTITLTGHALANHVCWTAGTTAPAAGTAPTCAAVGSDNTIGAAVTSGCSLVYPSGLAWGTAETALSANRFLSIIECDATTPVGIAKSFQVTSVLGSAVMSLPTVIASETPAYAILTLGITTPLANPNTIICTFSQPVFQTNGAFTVDVNGTSQTATAAVTGSPAGITVTIMATSTIAAALTAFNFSSNLAANYNSGNVTATCQTTTDPESLAFYFTTIRASTANVTSSVDASVVAGQDVALVFTTTKLLDSSYGHGVHKNSPGARAVAARLYRRRHAHGGRVR